MERLQVGLLGRADLDEAHHRPQNGFGDRLGINDVALVGLHVRLHELGRHDPHRVAEHLQLARKPPGAGNSAAKGDLIRVGFWAC